MKIGYFPGCSLLGSSREYDESFRAIAPLLDIELQEIPDWNCCGASAAHSLNHKLALALPARILAQAEKAGMKEIAVPCSACYSRLAQTRQSLADDAALRREICETIDMEFNNSVEVLNVLDVLMRYAPADLTERAKTPFARKVACYYGCYLVRPAKIAHADRTEDPQMMDELVRKVGATPLDWAHKVECCGAGFTISEPGIVAKLSSNIIADAVGRGAEAIVVACPMCHTNFDLRRDAINKFSGKSYNIPVLFLSQVIGKALGLDDRTLGLHRHNVPVVFKAQEAVIPVKVENVQPAAGQKV